MKTEKHSRWITAFLSVAFLVLLLSAAFPGMAEAANTGWVKSSGKVYYYTNSGKKVKGLKKIGSYHYYFDKNGVMQTGWKNMSGKYRYFQASGALGKAGRMKINQFQNIGGKYFYFNKYGAVVAGFRKINGKYYYLNTSTKLGTRGAAVQRKWVKVKGKLRYFAGNCSMARNTWVGKYYVKSDGTIVYGWIKLGGYKYYTNKKGVRQTGLVTIGKYQYYFDKNGRLLTNTTVDGYVINAKGIATKAAEEKENNTKASEEAAKAAEEAAAAAKAAAALTSGSKPKVLVVAGHGQGDVGAYSTWGYEYKYTREFANLIVQRLEATGKVDVDFYKNGSTSFDLYQQHKSTLSSISTKITGKGTVRKQVITLSKKNSNIPVIGNYDYVLEVHFNATAESAKDPKGNGTIKGSSWYINQYNNTYSMENAVLKKLVSVGFKKFGTGIYKSDGLYNARICQELGADYGLLETAFIDDGDDMKFYKAHNKEMAIAVADTISAYLTK